MFRTGWMCNFSCLPCASAIPVRLAKSSAYTCTYTRIHVHAHTRAHTQAYTHSAAVPVRLHGLKFHPDLFLQEIQRHSMSSARLDAFARGQIVALGREGYSTSSIVSKVRKSDGSRSKPRIVNKTILKARLNPKWRGEKAGAYTGGRPRGLTATAKC